MGPASVRGRGSSQAMRESEGSCQGLRESEGPVRVWRSQRVQSGSGGVRGSSQGQRESEVQSGFE